MSPDHGSTFESPSIRIGALVAAGPGVLVHEPNDDFADVPIGGTAVSAETVSR